MTACVFNLGQIRASFCKEAWPGEEDKIARGSLSQMGGT